MIHTLMRTKLSPPPAISDAVRRDRLIERMAEGTRRPLTLLCAAAGSGKTQLLVSWLASSVPPGPIAWVSVDEGDRDAQLFWSYVFEALRACGAMRATVAAPSVDTPTRQVQLRELATDLAARRTPVILVLDDFEKITGPDVPAELEVLLHHCAASLRLVVSTRAEPPLPVHRYRLAGELTDVRVDELAFTEEEIRELVAGRGGEPATPEMISALRASTEGWAAGVRLLSMSTHGFAAPDGGADVYVAEYLTAEVLDALPSETRNFLRRTSVIESVWPELATVLTDRPDSGRVLAGLVRTNSFVRADYERGRSFRYHPLLRRLLLAELGEASPVVAGELRRTAATWLARHRTLREALAVAAAASDWTLASSLVVDGFAITSLLTGADRAASAELFKAAPPWDGDARTAVVLAATALAEGDTAGCGSRLARARKQAGATATSDVAVTLAMAVVETRLAWARADVQATLAAAATAQAVLKAQPDKGIRMCSDYWATLLNTVGAALLWSGDRDGAEATLRRACRIAERTGHRHSLVNALGQRALAALIGGHHRRAREFAIAASGVADELGVPIADRPPAASVALGWMAAEDGDLANGLVQARHARQASGQLRMDPVSSVLLARLQTRLGRRGQQHAWIGTGSAALPGPAWIADRFETGRASCSAQRDELTGTHGSVAIVASAAGPRLRAVPQATPCRPILVEPLTQKEQEVLSHLGALLSTAEVAQTMFISVNTVRTHIRGILRKLAVSHRNDAIRRARVLQLI